MRIQQHPSRRARRAPDQTLIADVLAGLKEEPKHLSPMYFYDEHGSHLFDRICTLPEYYLTRTETHILALYAREIASQIGPDAVLVELGSGASTKTRLLLDQMPELAAYVPVDISRSHLFAAARGIRESYPDLEVLPVCADFTQPFAVPTPRRAADRVVVFFPGSTIGNFDPPAAVELLRTMRRIAGDTGALLIGYDFVKDRGILEPAYNDAAGVTAEFNLNALVRLNRELGTDFDVTGFRHEAVWEPGASRMEMHLVSERTQDVTVGTETVTFAAGEHLVTEHCHKYTQESFAQLARAAGWEAKTAWTDERRYFNVQYLEPGGQG
ncbi:MAG TPA: L-histidine N(alpha)-methyltransferase [Steroidobacteraceae bacterium]|jgi:dimethylhistidine N-methyltransferase